MLEKTSWPSWLQNSWPSWLENIGYPATGVGDLQDLKFILGVGEGGRWIGFVHPGWYYYDNREQYKFVVKGTSSNVVSAGSGELTNPVSFRPAWGPVLVDGIYYPTDDLVHDLIAEQVTHNPVSNWSFGYKADLGGTFNLFTTYATDIAQMNSDPNPIPIRNWRRALNPVGGYQYLEPLIGIYDGTYPIHSYINWMTDGTPSVFLHTGRVDSGAKISVVRYTVPRTGTYSVNATFGVGDSGPVDGFDSGWVNARIVKNGTVIASALDSTGSVSFISGGMALTKGDLLDFEIHPFDDFYNDRTPISLILKQINGTGEAIPYVQHANSFYPGAIVSWSSIGSGLYQATLPASALMIGMRDLSTLPMGSVAGTASLISDKLYYYDQVNNIVTLKPKASSFDAYPDLVYTYPLLRMREVCIQEDGQVRASYGKNLVDVKLIRGSLTSTSSGTQQTSVFTVPTNFNTSDGDWIILDYFIERSFVLTKHDTLDYYTSFSLGDTLTTSWESSVPDIFSAVSLATTDTDLFNVNPLFSDCYRAGYLFHAQPASSWSSYWTPAKLRLFLDKDEVCSDWGELLKFTLTLTGDNDLPIPFQTVSVTATGGSAMLAFPSLVQTDGRGEIHVLFKPTIATGTFSVTGTVGNLVQVASASVVVASSMLDITKWMAGHVNVVITNDKSRRGDLTIYTNANSLDGIPRSYTTGSSNNINLTAQLSSEFYDQDNKTWAGSIQVSKTASAQDPAAISTIGYTPQSKDKLVAFSATGQSIIQNGEI